MCCDIHRKYPFLLVIGMYDGNVAVYNLQKNVSRPIYVSKGHGKHSDVVWEVKWGPDMQDGEINFYSISADGRVFNWVLMQNKLAITTIITLFMDKEYVGGPEGMNIKLKGNLHKHTTVLRQTDDNISLEKNNSNSLRYLHDIPSQATGHLSGRHRRGSHLQVQHRI